jgi:hypothetical protein
MASPSQPCNIAQYYRFDDKQTLPTIPSNCHPPQWLNLRGYGYQILSQGNACNSVESEGHCFNRLPRLPLPTSSPAIFAWKP